MSCTNIIPVADCDSMLYQMTLMSGSHHAQAIVMQKLLQCHQVKNQQDKGMSVSHIIIIIISINKLLLVKFCK